jgi:hypothetical protein
MLKNWFFWVIVLLVLAGGAFIYMEASKPRGAVTAPGETIADLGRGHITDISQVKFNSNPPTSGDHFSVWLKAGEYRAPVSDGYLIHSLEHGYVIISYNCDRSLVDSEFSIFNSQFSKEVYAADSTPSANVSEIMVKMQTPPNNASTFNSETAPYDTVSLSQNFQSDACKDLVGKLVNFSKNYTRIIIIPRPNMDHTLALTGWNHLLYQDKWNESEAKKFVDALENQGPEKTLE